LFGLKNQTKEGIASKPMVLVECYKFPNEVPIQ